MSENIKVAKAAGVVGAATLLSRIMGYVRDMVMSWAFGTTAAADAFYVAYRIPNLLRELLAEGSMSAAFIPVFTETLTKGIEGRGASPGQCRLRAAPGHPGDRHGHRDHLCALYREGHRLGLEDREPAGKVPAWPRTLTRMMFPVPPVHRPGGAGHGHAATRSAPSCSRRCRR